MEENWGVIGHEKNIQLLDWSLKNDKLAHAYFFSGLPNLGKTLVAEEFAKKILGTQNAWNLDVHKLELNEEEHQEITIEQAQEWRRLLFLKPLSGKKKIGIIYGAENLNEESSNALLKIIEEPAEGTIILIIASGSGVVLPTIISRSQILKFLPVKEETILTALLQKIKNEDLAKECVELSAGRPGLALRLAENKKFFNSVKSYKDLAENILQKDAINFWPRQEKMFKRQENFIGKSREAYAVVEQLEILLRDSLLQEYNLKSTSTQAKSFPSNIERAIGVINKAKVDLESNIQPKLILENLFINL